MVDKRRAHGWFELRGTSTGCATGSCTRKKTLTLDWVMDIQTVCVRPFRRASWRSAGTFHYPCKHSWAQDLNAILLPPASAFLGLRVNAASCILPSPPWRLAFTTARCGSHSTVAGTTWRCTDRRWTWAGPSGADQAAWPAGTPGQRRSPFFWAFTAGRAFERPSPPQPPTFVGCVAVDPSYSWFRNAVSC